MKDIFIKPPPKKKLIYRRNIDELKRNEEVRRAEDLLKQKGLRLNEDLEIQ